MNNQDQNSINEQVIIILREYDELKNEIDLLLREGNKSKSRTRGAISSAGVTAENLLIYIIRKSGRENKLTELRPNQRGLYEYKKIVEDIIPEKQKIHLGTIIPWRNLANHHNDNENITEDELRAVQTAINSIIKWFFDVYLKGEYVDFSNNAYVKKEKQTESSKAENVEVLNKLNKNPLNIPDYSILLKSKKVSQKRNNSRNAFIILILIILLLGLYFSNILEFSSGGISKEDRNKRIYATLKNYSDDLNSRHFDAYKYFSPKVDRFFIMHETRPKEINEYVNGLYYKQFQNPTGSFDEKTLTVKELGNNEYEATIIQYGTFYKTAEKKQYTNLRTRTELKFDENFRIKYLRSFNE